MQTEELIETRLAFRGLSDDPDGDSEDDINSGDTDLEDDDDLDDAAAESGNEEATPTEE